MGVAEYFERFVRAVWKRHYGIPEPVYWLAVLVLAALTIVGGPATADLIGVGLMLLAAVGIGRWHADRRRCRGALVLARFREGAGTEGHAEEAQRILIDQLRTMLTPKERRFIQRFPRRSAVTRSTLLNSSGGGCAPPLYCMAGLRAEPRVDGPSFRESLCSADGDALRPVHEGQDAGPRILRASCRPPSRRARGEG